MFAAVILLVSTEGKVRPKMELGT